MRPIRWLHISDIHLRAGNEWSQDVVLKAMCRNIGEQRAAGNQADFVLVTGDIAFSGKSDEYALAASFFDAVQTASGVSRERIFCVVGNHDIDRDRQKLCFRGARAEIRGPSQVDALLGGGEDLDALLMRQENYRHFQSSYFTGQDRVGTTDGLGYVSRLAIEGIQLAIVGLDSAWLAEGGMDDHGKLLIGERQAINAIDLVQGGNEPPNIIVGMAHHPLHLLQDFDRHPVRYRIEEIFHFFHCGHLHESEAHAAGPGGSGCLTLVAGASFETRQFHNAYCMVKLDLLRAVRNVASFQYNPSNGTFSLASSKDYPIEVIPTGACDVGELTTAMQTYSSALAPWAHYLSALLLNEKAELLIPTQSSYTFGSFDLLLTLSDSDLKRKTSDFMAFRNVLRVLYDQIPLPEIFARYGAMVRQYGEALTALSDSDPSLRERLEEHDRDVRRLSKSEPLKGHSHTLGLLADLAAAQEWHLLREQAERHANSAFPSVATQAKRMLAFTLANSDEPLDKDAAIGYYRSLAGSESAEFSDIGNLAILLADSGCMDDAAKTVFQGIQMFPEKSSYFLEIGQRVVGATGNRELRMQIENVIRGKT